jgi:hypothetical protein
MKTLTSIQKISAAIAVGVSSVLVFGVCSILKVPMAQAACPGGGYPQLECEIVNGKKVCVRRCQ